MHAVVHRDRPALARAAAELIAARASQGPITLGLAGGSTPADTYDALGDVSIDWENVSLWLSDERWVPHDHADSNGRMALEHLPSAASSRLVRPRYSPYLTPADSAVHYDAELRSLHGDKFPEIVLLGMGTDGHTASLFPDTDALAADPRRWFVENHVPQIDAWRLTVTPSLLHHAETVLVLVAGADKAALLADVLEGPAGRYPIQLLHEAQGEVTVLCDADAASALSV
ncbi:MAG: 6-phosphogluconolactonase [Acidimicrobiia bacterium]